KSEPATAPYSPALAAEDDWSAAAPPSDFDTDFEVDDTPLPEIPPAAAPSPAPAPVAAAPAPAPARPAPAPAPAPAIEDERAGLDRRTKLLATGASLLVLLLV